MGYNSAFKGLIKRIFFQQAFEKSSNNKFD